MTLTEPLWEVEMEAQHGERVFFVSQRVRAKNEADVQRRAEEAANTELHGMGRVVRVIAARRIPE